jgi:hypothetical protein
MNMVFLAIKVPGLYQFNQGCPVFCIKNHLQACPAGVSLFYIGEEVQCPVFCITRSKGRRFCYFLPLLGGGREGGLEKSKETPPSSSPKRGGEFGINMA